MPRISEVWHAKNPTFGFGEHPTFPGDYALAGRVHSDQLDIVFEQTNNICAPWTENDLVEAEPGTQRSTSVGDVVVTPDGRHWRCDNCGWTEIATN